MKKISIPIIDVKKYGGKQVAIVDGKIAASGRTLKEVIQIVKKQIPSKPLTEIRIFSVPETLAVIYYV
jgi:orotate phosphoribosyltransferase-like protein